MGCGECSRQEPRNLEPRKLILEAESYFSRKFAPPENYPLYGMRSHAKHSNSSACIPGGGGGRGVAIPGGF